MTRTPWPHSTEEESYAPTMSAVTWLTCPTRGPPTALPTRMAMYGSATRAHMDVIFHRNIGFVIGSMAVKSLLYLLASSATVPVVPSLMTVFEGPVDSMAIATVPRRPTVPGIST